MRRGLERSQRRGYKRAVVIEAHDISQRFAGRWVLRNLSFQVPAAATVLLTGDNGAGKTTLLRILATALRPTRGSLSLWGSNALQHLAALRRRLALLTHQHHLYDALSARQNLALAVRLAGRGSDPMLGDILAHVGLSAHADAPVGAFSAGMKRRLALAKMLLSPPELALLDEPFGQLDTAGVQLMERVLRQLKDAGATVIMSTHDIERGKALCDTHLHLVAGKPCGAVQALRFEGARP